MSYPRQSLDINPLGIRSDLPTWTVPPQFWTGGSNVRFRRGATRRIKGTRPAYVTNSLLDIPYKLLHISEDPIGSAQNDVWIYVGNDSQNVVDANETHTDITFAGGLGSQPEPENHSLFTLNGVAVHNNAVDDPMWWDLNTANNFVALPDWPANTIARMMFPFKFYLLAMNLTQSGSDFIDKIIWSDSADPGTVPTSWTPAPDNDAGSAILGDVPGHIITAAKLGEGLVIYKEAGSFLLQYVGGNDVFAIRPFISSLGARRTARSVVDINGRHVVWTPDDIVIHDGTSVQSIVSNKVKRRIFDAVDAEGVFGNSSFLFFNRIRNEVWVVFTDNSTVANTAAVYDIESGEWSFRSMERTVNDIQVGVVNDTQTNRHYSILAAETSFPDGFLRELDTDDAVSRTSTLARHDLDMGDSKLVKFVRAVHVQAANKTDLEIRVGGKFTLDGGTTWSAWTSAASGVTNISAMGRYISIELRSTTDDEWILAGLKIEFEPRGHF